MRLGRFAIVAVLAMAAALTTTNARAENPPSSWDRAKDPDAVARYRLHLLAENELTQSTSTGMLRENGARQVVMMLEHAHVNEMPDVTLRIDLGLAYEASGDSQKAILTLSKALEMNPHHPASGRALYSLAIAYAKSGRAEEEIATEDRYLKLETRPESRASVMGNRAEALMRLGDLRGAIDGYRDAIRLAEEIRTPGGVETYILAIWGLCVALDRNGDSTGALIEAKRAVSHDPNLATVMNDPNVFFVPEYERYYYAGMGELAIAALAATEREKAEHYDKAERRFRNYVNDATQDDRWLTRARAHLKLAESKIKIKDPKVARDPTSKDLSL